MDRIAYMQSVPEDDPREKCSVPTGATSPYGPILSPRFLAVILTQEPFASHLPAGWASFLCAQIDEEVKIYSASLPNLSFYGSTFAKSVHLEISDAKDLSFSKTSIGDDISFLTQNAKFLSLYKSKIKGSVGLEGRFETINLNDSVVLGKVSAERVKVTNNFLMIGAVVIPGFADDNLDLMLEKIGDHKAYMIVDSTLLPQFSEAYPYDTAGFERYEKQDAVKLQDANIGGNVALYHAQIAGEVDLLRTEVGQGLYAQESAIVQLSFSQAMISHDVVLRKARVKTVEGEAVSIGGNLSAAGAFLLDLDLLDVSVEGNILLPYASISSLNMARGKVGRSVHLRGQTSRGRHLAGRFDDVDLSFMEVGNELQMQGSYFGSVNLSSSRIGTLRLVQRHKVPLWVGNEFDRGLNLNGTHVETLAARFPDSFLDQSSERVHLFERHENLCGAVFRKPRPNTSEEVSEDLQLTQCQAQQPIWSYGDRPVSVALLRLQGRKFDPSWKVYVPMNLDRFHYGEIDEVLYSDALLETYDGRLNVNRLLDWLRNSIFIQVLEQNHSSDLSVRASDTDGEVFEAQMPDRSSVYHPFPYQFLSEYLRNRGFPHRANEIAWAMHVDRMKQYENTAEGWRRYLVDVAWRNVLGFGVYPQRALAWFVGLVFLGALVARKGCCPGSRSSFEQDPRDLAQGGTTGLPWGIPLTTVFAFNPPPKRPTISSSFFYSLENAVPLISPSEEHREWTYNRPWVSWFFHFQKVCGFVLISLLIASISLN